MSTIAEADAHYALEVGRENADRAWILSDRDVWYPNPFYRGPPVTHPECDELEDEPIDSEADLIWSGYFVWDYVWKDAPVEVDENGFIPF